MPTSNSTPPPAITQPLQCMEIIGGNRAVQQAVASPGMDLWVENRPVGGPAGGDIYYFSMCGSGRVTRLALADVAGHGADADQTAAWLRGLMRKHINLLDQRRLARAINRAMVARHDGAHSLRFATVLLLTYFAPTDHILVCNAGHPPPLWYSQRTGRWHVLDQDIPDPGTPLRQYQQVRYRGQSVANLPLGIIEHTGYVQFALQLAPHDLLVLYTDGIMEARNREGHMLGVQGLLELAKSVPLSQDPRAVAQSLLDAVARFRNNAPPEDDETLIVGHHSAGDPPRLTVGHMLRILPKMLGIKGL